MFAQHNTSLLSQQALSTLLENIDKCPLNVQVKTINIRIDNTREETVALATAKVSFHFEGLAVERYK